VHDVEVKSHMWRELVLGGIGIADRPGYQSVPFEEQKVVSDGSVIER